ncbi:uncharacterized protein LOC134202995 [Armigeres subalbatus]|uniref:uncharacterized protein LOC134202995 n=1 Tax=Armigeres subalbatus TaxID=124917 RepID=UPI002ED25444
MGKTSRKPTQKRAAKKSTNKNVRNEAKTKNLEFLLDPEQPRPLQIRAVPIQKWAHEKETSVAPVPATIQPPSEARTQHAEKSAVRVPLIDMDDDHNKHLLDIRSNLLRDWNSDTESDVDDSSVSIELTDSAKVVGRAKGNSLARVDKEAPIIKSYTARPVSKGEPTRTTEPSQKSFPKYKKTYISSSAAISTVVRSDIDMSDTDHDLISECPFEMRAPLPASMTEQSAGVCKLKRLNEESNIRCISLTDSLNAKVHGSLRDDVFTEEAGFPDKPN